MTRDARTIVGNKVHVLAKHVTSESSAKRLYGSLWNSRLVEGVVESATKTTLEGEKRSSTFIKATYTLADGSRRQKELNSSSVHAGPLPAREDHYGAATATTTTAAAVATTTMATTDATTGGTARSTTTPATAAASHRLPMPTIIMAPPPLEDDRATAPTTATTETATATTTTTAMATTTATTGGTAESSSSINQPVELLVPHPPSLGITTTTITTTVPTGPTVE